MLLGLWLFIFSLSSFISFNLPLCHSSCHPNQAWSMGTNDPVHLELRVAPLSFDVSRPVTIVLRWKQVPRVWSQLCISKPKKCQQPSQMPAKKNRWVVENWMSLADCVTVWTQCSGVWHLVTARPADEAETRVKLSASVPLALGTAKKRAVGDAKVWLPGALQQNLSDPGLRMGLIASVVLTGGGLHPAQ